MSVLRPLECSTTVMLDISIGFQEVIVYEAQESLMKILWALIGLQVNVAEVEKVDSR